MSMEELMYAIMFNNYEYFHEIFNPLNVNCEELLYELCTTLDSYQFIDLVFPHVNLTPELIKKLFTIIKHLDMFEYIGNKIIGGEYSDSNYWCIVKMIEFKVNNYYIIELIEHGRAKIDLCKNDSELIILAAKNTEMVKYLLKNADNINIKTRNNKFFEIATESSIKWALKYKSYTV